MWCREFDSKKEGTVVGDRYRKPSRLSPLVRLTISFIFTHLHHACLDHVFAMGSGDSHGQSHVREPMNCGHIQGPSENSPDPFRFAFQSL